MFPPNLFRIDKVNDIVKEKGFLWLPTQDPAEVLQTIEGFWLQSYVGDFLDIKQAAEEEDEEAHLHPSLITLGKDPFKDVTVSSYSRSRIVAASLEEVDRGEENIALREEAV